MQACLESMPMPEGCVLSVASVDVAVNAQVCDLMNIDTQRRWLAFVRDGHATGIGSGPPCETWSIARHQHIAGLKDGGPRPLRDDQCPWGRHDLKTTEVNTQRLWVFFFDVLFNWLTFGRFHMPL